MKSENEREKELTEAFDEALSQYEFIAYIQPKYNIYEQKFFGGEVLCRWKHKGEMISPGEFIPIFEKNGMIKQLDRYMFIETLKIIHNWLRYHMEPVPLSVNLSRINFYNPNLSQELLDLIDEFQISHNLIQIEITESAYTELEEEVILFVDCMRAHDIDILMDDFGSGYSSLNVLKDMDVSVLKVDYRFLNASKIKHRRERILESVVKLARTIEVPIIIEGVEEETDVIFLKTLGVRYVQGFLFGKPMPVSEFEKIPHLGLRENRTFVRHELPIEHEIFDLESPVYMIYENSLCGMAVCEYNKDGLYFLQMNHTMQKSAVLSLLNLRHSRESILNYLSEEDANKCRQYIQNVCARKSSEEYIEVVAPTPIGQSTLRVRFFYLSQKGEDIRLLTEIIQARSDLEKINELELFEILDKLDRGYYILDDNHTVLYANAQARKLLPHFIPGVKCTDYKRYDEDCSQCPLDNYNKLLSYYSQNLDKFIENYIVEIKLNGQMVKLVRIDESHQKVIGSKEAVMRMNKAIARDNDVYTEVDLATMQYSQITFAKRKVFDIPSKGTYDESFDEMIEHTIDPTTNQEVLEYFSGEGMKRHFADGKRIRAKYKFAGMDAWAECIGTYIQEDDKQYCCIYTSDITDQIEKEYDSLTHLISSEAMKQIMNDYILEQSTKTAVVFRVDFDDFKKINTVYGYLYGDKVLRAFAKMIQMVSKKYYYASRIGGDEFLIFVTDMNDSAAIEAFREKLEEGIRSLVEEMKIDAITGVHLGMAIYPVDGQSFDELYKKAEK